MDRLWAYCRTMVESSGLSGRFISQLSDDGFVGICLSQHEDHHVMSRRLGVIVYRFPICQPWLDGEEYPTVAQVADALAHVQRHREEILDCLRQESGWRYGREELSGHEVADFSGVER